MTLYDYDHCPYCVKARMIFGIKSIPVEVKTLLNDDEKTPISMVGKKTVPILEKDDGTFMGESLDIIAYADALPGYGDPVVGQSKNSEPLKRWLEEIRRYHYALAMPRWVSMGLEEFKTSSARQYFINKKQSSIGPFEDNVFLTQSLIDYAEKHLQELESLISSGPYFWGEELTIDDFNVFASLRCLTTTKDLVFPEKSNAYLKRLSEITKVPLHWDKALGGGFDVLY